MFPTCIRSFCGIDERLINALNVACEWMKGNASVGDSRKASVVAHAVARECTDSIAIAVARSVRHGVATAHMADHSLGAAWHALKAVKNAGKSVDNEKKGHDEQLPLEIKEMVLTARNAERFKKYKKNAWIQSTISKKDKRKFLISEKCNSKLELFIPVNYGGHK
ncbi:MAG: putative immunity protein [Methanobacterium sp.]